MPLPELLPLGPASSPGSRRARRPPGAAAGASAATSRCRAAPPLPLPLPLEAAPSRSGPRPVPKNCASAATARLLSSMKYVPAVPHPPDESMATACDMPVIEYDSTCTPWRSSTRCGESRRRCWSSRRGAHARQVGPLRDDRRQVLGADRRVHRALPHRQARVGPRVPGVARLREHAPLRRGLGRRRRHARLRARRARSRSRRGCRRTTRRRRRRRGTSRAARPRTPRPPRTPSTYTREVSMEYVDSMFLIIAMIDAASPCPRVMSAVLPEVLPNQLKQLLGVVGRLLLRVHDVEAVDVGERVPAGGLVVGRDLRAAVEREHERRVRGEARRRVRVHQQVAGVRPEASRPA